MSFALTTEQIRNRTKTVTRRTGWRFLKPGDRVQAVAKSMGLKAGEKAQPLAVLRVESVRREPLSAITNEEVAREGFPDMTDAEFCEFFCEHNGLVTYPNVTRIEFSYVDEPVPAGAVARTEGIATGGPRAGEKEPTHATRIHTEEQFGGVVPNRGSR